MTFDWIGPPQVVALAVLAQRGAEEAYSGLNTRRLLVSGAIEAGRAYYPVVAVTHLAWIASIFLLVPPAAPVIWPAASLYVLLQGLRYWVIGTLGRYWTHRIVTLGSAPIVRRGPYRFVRHPNYVVTVVETFLLPLVFGTWQVAVILGAVWTAVVWYKSTLEDEALAARRPSGGA